MGNIKNKPSYIKGAHGVRIPPAVCVLPTYHPCYGCVWYDRNVDVLFCPFRDCIRNKEEFDVSEGKEVNNDN